MSIKPILFNTEMVQAILEGRKTVTRRLIKPQPSETAKLMYCYAAGRKSDIGKWSDWNDKDCKNRWIPPFHGDDILYVRETWRVRNVFGDIARGDRTAEIEFMAGGETVCIPDFDYPPSYGAWKPSIHMSKEAARLFLRVKRVSVERLQDISVEDAKKEGAFHACGMCFHWHDYCGKAVTKAKDCKIDGIYPEFPRIWDSTIKKSEKSQYGWDANPWVWVIEFERCEKPVEVNCNG